MSKRSFYSLGSAAHKPRSFKVSHRLPWLLGLTLSCLASQSTLADTPSYTLTQTGALFMEAPPGRDKNLSPFMGASGSGEKVETHLVISFKNRLIVDAPTFGREAGVINAIGLYNSKDAKAQANLGTAELSGFRRVSEDKRKALVSMAINRLPDKPVAGVSFEGSVKVVVAQSIRKVVVPFQVKEGFRIAGVPGLNGDLEVSKVEGTSFVLRGAYPVTALASVTLMPTASTGKLSSERTSYSSQSSDKGTVTTSQWQFPASVQDKAGKLELGLMDGVETVEVPVSVVVAKPY